MALPSFCQKGLMLGKELCSPISPDALLQEEHQGERLRRRGVNHSDAVTRQFRQ